MRYLAHLHRELAVAQELDANDRDLGKVNTVHLGYNDSGYNDILFVMIRSHGISIALWVNR